MVNSGATEVWYDNVDQDCDGWSDFDQDRDGEWIELYNADSSAINLQGWTLRGDDGDSITLPRSLVVPPGEHVVLGASDNTLVNGGVDVDYTYDRENLSLSSEDNLFLVVDGDGADDLLVGAPRGGTNGSGRVYVVLGR